MKHFSKTIWKSSVFLLNYKLIIYYEKRFQKNVVFLGVWWFITHQPFLAAGGLAHFRVNKKVINGVTYTSIAKLTTKKQRKHELVELIGGGFGEANDYASKLLDRAAA